MAPRQLHHAAGHDPSRRSDTTATGLGTPRLLSAGDEAPGAPRAASTAGTGIVSVATPPTTGPLDRPPSPTDPHPRRRSTSRLPAPHGGAPNAGFRVPGGAPGAGRVERAAARGSSGPAHRRRAITRRIPEGGGTLADRPRIIADRPRIVDLGFRATPGAGGTSLILVLVDHGASNLRLPDAARQGICDSTRSATRFREGDGSGLFLFPMAARAATGRHAKGCGGGSRRGFGESARNAPSIRWRFGSSLAGTGDVRLRCYCMPDGPFRRPDGADLLGSSVADPRYAVSRRRRRSPGRFPASNRGRGTADDRRDLRQGSIASEAHGGIIANAADGSERPVPRAPAGRFLFLSSRIAPRIDGVLIEEDADSFGSALDLAVDALERARRAQLRANAQAEVHRGEYVVLGHVYQPRELGRLRPSGSATRRHCQ